MAYTSWSVVFGEQPAAAKWNILGTNDSSFNDGTGIGSGAILSTHLKLTGSQTATVTTLESTTSATFTDLTTPGPAVTVTIGSSGIALLILSAALSNSIGGDYAAMGFVASGANTVAATFNDSLANQTPGGVSSVNEIQASFTKLLTGYAAGSTTFTSKYEIVTGGTASFRFRKISVVPL